MWVSELILTGVSEHPDLQLPLFFVVLVMYRLTMAGNLIIITPTSVDPRLQTPMYFFLRHLAIINLDNSTVIAPKMLTNVLVKRHTTSYYECATQVGGFLVFIVAEVFMLAVLAYDCYEPFVPLCSTWWWLSQWICLLQVSLTYPPTLQFFHSYCSFILCLLCLTALLM